MSFMSMDLYSPRSVVIPDCFKGLKVFLVDHDKSSLMYMASALEEESYKVTTTELASSALSMIGERKIRYDIVIAEIDMPEMDGFEFLRKFLTISDIPIIMMSSSRDLDLAKRAITQGASFFFSKPIRIHNLVNIWQHVFRERLERQSGEVLLEKKGFSKANTDGLDLNFGKLVSSVLEINTNQQNEEEEEEKCDINEKNEIENCNNMVHVDATDWSEVALGTNSIGDQQKEIMIKRKRLDDATDEKDGKRNRKDKNWISPEKKSSSRLTWTPELKLKFREAVSALGEDRAQPTAILKLMRTPHLTTRHIGSYLQKYRQKMKRNRYSQSSPTEEYEPWKPNNMYNSTSQSPQMPEAINPAYKSSLRNFTPSSLYAPNCSTPMSLHFHRPQLNTEGSSYYKLETLEKLLLKNNLSSSATRKTSLQGHNFGDEVDGYSDSSGIHQRMNKQAEKIVGNEGCKGGAGDQMIPAANEGSNPVVSQEVQNLIDFSSGLETIGFDMEQLISTSEDIFNMLEGFCDASLGMDAITPSPNAPPSNTLLPQEQAPVLNNHTIKPLGGEIVSESSISCPKVDEMDCFLQWLELPPNFDDEFNPFIGSF